MFRFVVIVTIILVSVTISPAFAQAAEKRGLQPDIVYGNVKHEVTLTFYLGRNDSARLESILDLLQAGNVSKAVFLLQPGFNQALANSIVQRGYTMELWNNTDQYNSNYPPTQFNGILLSDRDILTRTNKMADIKAFLNLALHSANKSVVAFTPSVPAKFNATTAILKELLKDDRKTLMFIDGANSTPQPVKMATAGAATTIAIPPIGANTSSSVIIRYGSWDMHSLQSRYPGNIRLVNTSLGAGYLVNTTLIIGENAELNIANENLFLASPRYGDEDRRIEIDGKALINNALISSLNISDNAPDANPYHQRPFLFVDKGHLDIKNSSISYMGFPVAGLSNDRSGRSAIMFQHTANFTISNSTIAFNFDGIFVRDSSNFQIMGNKIYGNLRSGVDIRAGSHNFAIISNHVHDNGYEGIMCTECINVSIINNTIEHNEEAGIMLAHSNFTNVHDNTARYNEKFGIYLKDNSTDSKFQGNILAQSEEGITLTGYSNNNFLVGNTLIENDHPIVADLTSRSNIIQNNNLNGRTFTGANAITLVD